MASIIWDNAPWPYTSIPFILNSSRIRGTQTNNIRHIIAKGNKMNGIEAKE